MTWLTVGFTSFILPHLQSSQNAGSLQFVDMEAWPFGSFAPPFQREIEPAISSSGLTPETLLQVSKATSAIPGNTGEEPQTAVHCKASTAVFKQPTSAPQSITTSPLLSSYHLLTGTARLQNLAGVCQCGSQV